MKMLAAMFDMANDGARLPLESEAFFYPVDEVGDFRPGKLALPGVGIDGKAIQVFAAFRGARLRLPLRKGSVKVAGDGSAQGQQFNPLVVDGVHEVGGKLLPAAAL